MRGKNRCSFTCNGHAGCVVFQGEVDASWVFMGWEGVAAEVSGVELNSFNPEDYGV